MAKFSPGHGAPRGNQNAAKAKVWSAAIERALERRTVSRTDGLKEIDALADLLIVMCWEKDLAAFQELGNRLEGKPAQAIDVTQHHKHATEYTASELEQILRGHGTAAESESAEQPTGVH